MILESSTNASYLPNNNFSNVNGRRGSRSKSMSKMTPTDDIQPTNPFRMPFNLAQEQPLFGLAVYVEIFSNETNISETSYSYLEKLGATVEKRMNKKCNLLIWKDGSLKTIEKAKEYNATVVNSLWLEDCIENQHRASFDKFKPSLPNEADIPFLSFQNKKKRKTMDPLCPEHFVDQKDQKTLVAGNKKRKTNFSSQTTMEEDKIEVNLGRQTKINDFFSSNRLSKSSVLGKKSTSFADISSSPLKNKFNFNNQENLNSSTDSKYKRLMTNGPFLREAINFENKSRDFEEEKEEEDKHSSVRSSPKFMTKPCASVGRFQSIDLFGLNKTNEESGSKVKNMILSYTNKYTMTKSTTNLETEKIPPKPQEVKEEKKETILETKGRVNMSKSQPLGNNAVNMSKSQPLGNNAPSKDRKSVSKLENILFKCFGTKNPTKPVVPEAPPVAFTNKLATKSHSSKDAVVENKDNKVVERTYRILKKDVLGDQKPQPQTQPQNDSVKMEVGKDSKTIITPFGRVTCFNSVKTFSNLQPSGTNTQLPSLKITGSSEQAMKNRELINKWLKESVSAKTKRHSMSIEQPEEDKEALEKTTKSEKPQKEAKMTNDKTGVSTRSSRSKGLESKDKESVRRNTTSRSKRETIIVSEAKDDYDMKITKKQKQENNSEGILFTNLGMKDLFVAREFCQKFDFKYINDDPANHESLQYLVYQGPQLPKNNRVASAMVQEKSIVKYEWVEESLKRKEILNHQDYLTKYSIANRKSLFSKTRFFVDKDPEQIARSRFMKEELVTLIEEAGGLVLENVRACDFYVTKKTGKKNNNIPAHVKVVTFQWVIDSIIEGKFLNTQHVNYIIF